MLNLILISTDFQVYQNFSPTSQKSAYHCVGWGMTDLAY